MKIRGLSLLFLLTVTSVPALAQESAAEDPTLTLNQALAIAQESNRQIKIFKQGELSANDQILGGAHPEISAIQCAVDRRRATDARERVLFPRCVWECGRFAGAQPEHDHYHGTESHWHGHCAGVPATFAALQHSFKY